MSGETPKPKIIDSVPGFERAQREEQAPQEKVVENVDFKGDPRRVVGHPANVVSEASQAYGDYLRGQEGQAETPSAAELGSVVMSEVATNADDTTIRKEDLQRLREGLPPEHQ